MVMNLQLCFHNGMHLLANSATLTSQQHLHSGREPPLQGIDVIMKIDVLCSLLESGSEQLRRISGLHFPFHNEDSDGYLS